ncbi:nitronate monooxygenase [Actinocorallia herbida]|uniref:Nitronate monooxygenase n=1 Tax=Actinocorallia herbida TaxID=58109 RepID=A0A3N1CTV2_9ACTN|nr:nitronate monooxygenase [Actinocorallia herbida]
MTPVCRMLGMRSPVVQAPIGSASTPELAAAVARAGGLGTLALTWAPAAEVGPRVARTLALSDGAPIAVNLVLAFPVADRLAECLDAGARIVSTFWGDPAPLNPRIKAAGAVHLHTVGSAAEAVAAADSGVDVIIAQGAEAGGHVWGKVPTMALVPAVVDALAGRAPVIAAGGIADGRGLAAALALGAQAAWMGTRFLASHEAATHDEYRRQVLAASETASTYTLAFDGGWPAAPHRALHNSTLDAWTTAGRPPAPNRPGEGDVLAHDPSGRPHLRYADTIPLPTMNGDLEAMALYAGTSAALVHEVLPAPQIITDTVHQARRILTPT